MIDFDWLLSLRACLGDCPHCHDVFLLGGYNVLNSIHLIKPHHVDKLFYTRVHIIILYRHIIM